MPTMTARSPAALAAWPTTAMAWPVPRTVGSTVVRRSGGMPSLGDSSPVLGHQFSELRPTEFQLVLSTARFPVNGSLADQ